VQRDHSDLDLLIRGFQISRLIRVVADLGLADRISHDDWVDASELARSCDVRPQPLLRILRALAAFGVFQVAVDGRIAHSSRSLRLRTDAANSLHDAARYWTARGSWRAWGELDAALTGGTPHRVAWNTGRFEYLRDHPEEAHIFHTFMARTPDGRLRALAAAYDFSNATVIVDVGGGNGEALRLILSRYPHLRGLVFDREDVIAAIPLAERLDGRIAVESGSFFERVPAGADVYLLNWILHDWSDEDCLRILRNCRAAMDDRARLLIGEALLDPDPARGEPTAYLLDAHMMAIFGEARERTESEFRDLLASSGFAVERSIATPSPFSLIEAVPR
jgi:hypothetical protein